MTYSDLNNPGPQAYYLHADGNSPFDSESLLLGPIGCNVIGEHPECSTIFEGYYRPQLGIF